MPHKVANLTRLQKGSSPHKVHKVAKSQQTVQIKRASTTMKLAVLLPIFLPAVVLAGTTRGATPQDTCVTAADCSKEHYCTLGADAFCLPMGDCNVVSDCKNPANSYGMASCVGETVCDEQGSCGIICDDGFDDEEPIVLPTVLDLCATDADCSKKDYCTLGADAFCLPMGDCNVVSDCKNPSNSYGMASCVGETVCDEQGSCGIICDDGFDNEEPIVPEIANLSEAAATTELELDSGINAAGEAPRDGSGAATNGVMAGAALLMAGAFALI
jgi:hypothetical protein